MRRQPRRAGAAFGAAVQPGRVAPARHVHGRLAQIRGDMRQRHRPAVELQAVRLEFEPPAQPLQQRQHPELARLAGGGAGGGQRGQALLEGPPMLEGVGPGAGDLVADGRAAVQAEVDRTLAGPVFEPVQQVGREQPALDAQRTLHHVGACGSST
ncbi:hypothetical protein [Azohydromonas aeria]|uniref:hypothetical protein n=1 Tax=Azohydromonas aeria TaxID=2590212 RepID=UPI0012F75082|nr:hypothetical protein [Azohydromonas aeria]